MSNNWTFDLGLKVEEDSGVTATTPTFKIPKSSVAKKTNSGSSASWFIDGPLGRAPVLVARNQKVDAYANTGISKISQLPSKEGRRVELDLYCTGSLQNTADGTEKRVPISASVAIQAPCTEHMGTEEEVNSIFTSLIGLLLGTIQEGESLSWFDLLQGQLDVTDKLKA
jgi:hypothetical protein